MAGENELNIADVTIGNFNNPNSFQPTEKVDNSAVVDTTKIENTTKVEPEVVVEKPVVEDPNSKPEESLEVTLSETGDLLDSKGEVLYKKGEFTVKTNADGSQEIEVASSEDVDIVRDLIKDEYGIELIDEQNQPKKYENSHKGFAAMVNDAADIKIAQIEDALWAKYPQAKAFITHLEAGRDTQSFFNTPTTYRNISIPTETEENKTQLKTTYRDLIIAEQREMLGYNNATKEQKTAIDKKAEQWYNYLEQSGTDRENAINAQKILAANEIAKEASRDAENQAILDARQKSEDIYWAGLQDAIVTKGAIGKINIPKAERQGFYDYISKPVNAQGQTQEYLDCIAEGEANTIMNTQLALLRYNKFDLSKIIKMEVATTKAEELKLIGSKKTLKIVGGLPVTKTSNDLDMITVANIKK